jgi:hypothetical protein
VEQTQTNVNVTDQQASQSGSGSARWSDKSAGGSIQKVENSTEQSNRAKAVNVPIVSGTNVSVLSNGGQSSSAGVEQTQTNVNVTKQSASQSGGSYGKDTKRCKQKQGRFASTKQSVRNRTSQDNEAKAINLPILSGNNVSVLSNGRQSASAGVEQTQTNVNVTKQSASQSGGSYGTDTKRCTQKDGRFASSKQSVRNWTDQQNEAKAFNLPILSGNNVSVLSNGKQWSSAGVEQTQTNVNYTVQQAYLRP